jgi:WD40 repeat protein
MTRIADGQALWTARSSGDPLIAMAIGDGDDYVVSGDAGGLVAIWSLAQGKLVREFAAHDASIIGIICDRRTIISCCHGIDLHDNERDSEIKIWKAR